MGIQQVRGIWSSSKGASNRSEGMVIIGVNNRSEGTVIIGANNRLEQEVN